MKKLIGFLAFTLCAWAVQAAVTVAPSTVTLYTSTGTVISRGHATVEACAAAAQNRGPGQYGCGPTRSRVTVTADTPPPPPPPPPPPSTGGETVGSWPATSFAQPYRISMAPGSYPVWVAGGARHENVTGAWDGGNAARIYPPTAGQTYGGIGGFNLPSGTTTLSLRWEMRTGPTYASGGQGFDDNKHVIIHTTNGNRPMLNIQPAGGGCLQAAIAQGTVKQFNQSAQGGSPAGYFRGEGNYRFRWCDSGSSANTVAAGEWITIELQVSCAQTLHASGHIRAIVTRRSSATPVADWWIPWNYDSPARCTNITGIEAIGDYYNGSGNGATGTWFDIAGVTIAVNRSTILGPRAGF